MTEDHVSNQGLTSCEMQILGPKVHAVLGKQGTGLTSLLGPAQILRERGLAGVGTLFSEGESIPHLVLHTLSPPVLCSLAILSSFRMVEPHWSGGSTEA